jgi:hypothetical protein
MASVVNADIVQPAERSSTHPESSRWKAPELLEGEEIHPTPASDVYGWAMSVLECLTTKRPYKECKRVGSNRWFWKRSVLTRVFTRMR